CLFTSSGTPRPLPSFPTRRSSDLEHVIDNERSYAKILAKAGGDEALARRRVVKKKPPEGTISWGKPTFERLVAAEPEPPTSSFRSGEHTSELQSLTNILSRPLPAQ